MQVTGIALDDGDILSSSVDWYMFTLQLLEFNLEMC